MASGHVNRVNRPNTWLHRPMLQNVKKALANSEPSTHGTFRAWDDVQLECEKRCKADMDQENTHQSIYEYEVSFTNLAGSAAHTAPPGEALSLRSPLPPSVPSPTPRRRGRRSQRRR